MLHEPAGKFVTPTQFYKRHSNPAQFAVESKLLEIARAAGCAPPFTIQEPMTIRMPRLLTLAEWWMSADEPHRQAMARAILRQLRTLHSAGVCHRDLKAVDIVLVDNEPLFVDFELGTEVDPASDCYDLRGPASGIPLPPIHAAIGLQDGVWWDSSTPWVRPLWRDLGRLEDVGAIS